MTRRFMISTPLLEKDLSLYPSICYKPGDKFSQLLSTLDLNQPGIYVVLEASGSSVDWLLDPSRIVYVGKAKVLSKRVGVSSHHAIGSLRYLDISFKISFLYCAESELAALEAEVIKALQPQWNVNHNSQEAIAPQKVYGLLPYIIKHKGDTSLALESYAIDHPVFTEFIGFSSLMTLINSHKYHDIITYKEFGEALLVIQEKLKGATKTSPITTDLGVFTSFEDYLRQYYYENPASKVKKTQARKYMFLAKHWYVAEAIKLFDEQGCYRLEATLKVIRWALEKEEAGYNLEDLDHSQFFAELYAKKEPKQQSPYMEELISLRAEVDRLRVENELLKAQFKTYRLPALEESFAL